MTMGPQNGGPRVSLTPQGASLFLGVLVAVYLQGVSSREELEDLIAALSRHWLFAQEHLAEQAESFAATDPESLRILLDALIAHLRGSFEL